MVVVAIVIGIVLVAALLFAIAEVVFGPAGAVALASIVGFCFGGPPGAGVGIVAGLVLIPVVHGLGFLLGPAPVCASSSGSARATRGL